VKIISDHPYPWHGAKSTDAPPERNSNRSGGAHKSRKSQASKKTKTLVLVTKVYNLMKTSLIANCSNYY